MKKMNLNFSNINFANIRNDLIKLIDITDNKDCWFQCVHSYSVFYKTPIQIIKSQFIIKRLMPLDASMVGLVCGEVYKKYFKKIEILQNTFNRYLNSDESFYKLLIINRDGSIEYETATLERHFEKNSLELIKKKEYIKNFSPFDAYYIGFLAGLELYKIKNNLNSNKNKKPILRLINF